MIFNLTEDVLYYKRIFVINGIEPKNYSVEFRYQAPPIKMVQYCHINVSAVNEIQIFSIEVKRLTKCFSFVFIFKLAKHRLD